MKPLTLLVAPCAGIVLAIAIAPATKAPTPSAVPAAAPSVPFHHPHDVCSVVALPPTFPAEPTVFTASWGSMNLFLRSRNRGFGWRNMRTGMHGHQVIDCAVAPDWESSRTMFVALGEGGLQRSVDGGDTWQPPLLDGNVRQVEVATPVGATRAVVCGRGTEIHFSRDGGESWMQIGEMANSVVAVSIPNSFHLDPFIAVGTAGSVIHLRRGADEWSQTAIPSPAQTICFSPTFRKDRTIWVGTYGHGLLKSVDAGLTFRRVPAQIPTHINDIAVAPNWPECRDIFIATPKGGVHVSRDGAKTWESVPLHVVETKQTENHYQTIRLSPDYPKDPTVYCGAYEGLYCSQDAGENWFELNLNPTRIGRKIAISPGFADDGHVFLAGYGNPLSVSTEAGEKWEFRARGNETMGAYSVAVSPDFMTDGIVLLGVSGGLLRSADGGESWQKIKLPPKSPSLEAGSYQARQILFSEQFATDRSVFAVTTAGFYFSEDGGETWGGYEIPMDWVWRFTVAPNWSKNKTAFLGGHSVWRTDDGGRSWSKIAHTGKVLGIVCPPGFEASGEMYLVSRERGLMRSMDRGHSWIPYEGSFEGYSPTGLRLSPRFATDRTMFVSTLAGGMFVSRDAGATWSRCAPLGSPIDACFDFEISPNFAADSSLFGCTFEGMVKSSDAGKTWQLTTDVEIYDDARDPWIFRGNWTRRKHKRSVCFGVHMARSAGREANLAFTGTGVRLYGVVGPDHGRCEILIDGTKVVDVDCYAAKRDVEKLLFQSEKLEQGFHDICVRVTGEADPRSANSWVSVDAAIVDYRPGDDDNPQFARLENIYLTLDASYARDTRAQNAHIAELHQSIKAGEFEGAGKPDAAGEVSYDIGTADAELSDHLRAMREQLIHITNDVKVLHDRIRSLDRAILQREKALDAMRKQGRGEGR